MAEHKAALQPFRGNEEKGAEKSQSICGKKKESNGPLSRRAGGRENKPEREKGIQRVNRGPGQIRKKRSGRGTMVR